MYFRYLMHVLFLNIHVGQGQQVSLRDYDSKALDWATLLSYNLKQGGQPARSALHHLDHNRTAPRSTTHEDASKASPYAAQRATKRTNWVAVGPRSARRAGGGACGESQGMSCDTTTDGRRGPMVRRCRWMRGVHHVPSVVFCTETRDGPRHCSCCWPESSGARGELQECQNILLIFFM